MALEEYGYKAEEEYGYQKNGCLLNLVTLFFLKHASGTPDARYVAMLDHIASDTLMRCDHKMEGEAHTSLFLVPSPDGIKPLTLKWLFINKHDEENTIIRNKTRLVVRGYRQEEGIDFEECFAPVARMELSGSSWHTLHTKDSHKRREHGTTSYLHFFSKGTIDPTLFTRRFDDDILVVNQSPSGIFINQSKYVHEILKKYGLNTCDILGTLMDIKDKLDLDQIRTPVDATKYRSMIGALMYLTSSRPDIVHATCDSGFELTGFSDADYAGCEDTFKSTSGGAQFLGEKLVSWSSKKQDCTSLSTAKSEYVSLSACCA
nr:hypothetical protein [Tanacetum cinerariifolium]